jgi:hypothetical protein
MKLPKIDIPDAFKKNTPPGFKLVKKGARNFLVVQSIFCRNGHNLLDDSVHIHGEPALKLTVSIGEKKGIMFIDSFWGSHAKLFSLFPGFIEDHALVEAQCPQCGVSMMAPHACDIVGCGCGTGILFRLPGEDNRVSVCAKLGCPGHKLTITSIPNELVEAISQINFFGEGADDLFGDF